MVEYRQIKRLPNMRFGSDGSFWRFIDGKWKLIPRRNKWRRTIVYEKGKSAVALSRLILEAFHGPVNATICARHLNDDPTDDRLSNLAWGTSVDNAQDRRRNNKDPLLVYLPKKLLTALKKAKRERTLQMEIVVRLAASLNVTID